MIARLLVRPFGSIWKLKDRCKRNDSFLHKFYIFLYNWYQYEHGSAISYKAQFDGTPILPRGTKQIIITDDVRIGKNSTIYQQVTIQSNTLHNLNSGSPTIGDNCYIYPGAKIIGDITIGNNVIIGPNAVIMQNIPDNTQAIVETTNFTSIDNNSINSRLI